jgi:hypothetical protein
LDVVQKKVLIIFWGFYRFQKALREYGCSDLDVFQTVDLYEKKDISNVTTTLFALGRNVSFSPNFNNLKKLYFEHF